MMAGAGEEGLPLLRMAKREGGTCPLALEPGRRSPFFCITCIPSALVDATVGCACPHCQLPIPKITSAVGQGRKLQSTKEQRIGGQEVNRDQG